MQVTAVTNTLDYYDTELITAVKSIIVQAPGNILETNPYLGM